MYTINKNYIYSIVIVILLLKSNNSHCQKRMEGLVEHLENYIEEKNIPGIMISVVGADTIFLAEGIGYASLERKEKVTPKHLFRQGSVSKSFTALSLYKLLIKNNYSLDTPIKKIDENIPFINKWEDDYPICVSHVLEHTSGFDDFHLHAMYNKANDICPPAFEMVKDHQKSLVSRWKPGTKKAYSNPNYILAGHLIEKLSSVAYSEAVYKNILLPIGMESSGFYFKEPKEKLMAMGYQRRGETCNPISFVTINGGPAGDFCSNAKDMAIYLQVMLKKDTVLFSEEEYNRIEKPQTSIAAKKGLATGYGLGNYSIWKNGFLFHGHGGQIEGFSSRYLYSREANLGVSVSMNRNGDANALMDEVLKFILNKNEDDLNHRKILPIPSSLKNKFSGFYEFKSPRNKLLAFSERMLAGLILNFDSDTAITRTILGKAKDTLFYAGNSQFYKNNEGVPSIILLDSETDKPALWINDNYAEKESRGKRLIIFFSLFFSILIVVSYVLYSCLYLFIRIFRRKGKSRVVDHLILLGAIFNLILVFLGFGLTVSNAQHVNGKNIYSLMTYIGSFVMVGLSFTAVWRWFKFSDKKGLKVYYILTSIAMLILSLYLWSIGFVGLKLWSY